MRHPDLDEWRYLVVMQTSFHPQSVSLADSLDKSRGWSTAATLAHWAVQCARTINGQVTRDTDASMLVATVLLCTIRCD